jgi:hypothetical protein
MRHTDLMFNVTRVLAKLSLHESLRVGINSDPAHLLDLLVLLEMSRLDGQGLALVVRVAFTLGNLTASNEQNRMRIGVKGGASVLKIIRRATELSGKGEEVKDDGDELEEASSPHKRRVSCSL